MAKAKVLLLHFVLLYIAFAIMRCSATNYIVGDNSGWDISTNLDTWLQDKKFKVGDTLVFQYSSSQSIDEVTRENFKTCNTNKVLATFGNGNTTVPLTKPGDRYFVSSNKLYCLGGMKLHVQVQDDNANSPGPAPTRTPGKAVRVAGSDDGTSTLPRQSASSKKNTPLTSGAINCAKYNNITLQLVYIIVIMVGSVFWMFQN